MKKIFVFVFVLFAVLGLQATDNPKYVFLFIGDGMSTPQRMIADEFSRKLGNGQLAEYRRRRLGGWLRCATHA